MLHFAFSLIFSLRCRWYYWLAMTSSPGSYASMAFRFSMISDYTPL
jgi:hypothetical protein